MTPAPSPESAVSPPRLAGLAREGHVVLSVCDDGQFAQAVEAASHANVMGCLQCRKCSSGCPVAARADIQPHQMVRLVQFGQQDRVLASRMIWECTSCQTCISRCPQQVDIASMNDALRQMACQAGTVAPGTAVTTFNSIFLRTIRRLGRMYEMGLMASFKLRTMRLLADVGKFPMMLFKRKLSILPPWVGGRGARKALFRRARASASAAESQIGGKP